MNVGRGVRALAQAYISAIPRALLKSNGLIQPISAPLNVLKFPVSKKLCVPSMSFLPNAISLLDSSPSKIRREISDPLAHLRIGITPPPRQSRKDEVSLPNLKEEEYVEPPKAEILEKRAARLIVIRRAKMKKHKWKKLQKKMKFVFARRRQRRELKKEKAFQALLLSKIKDAERWNVEEYVSSKLKTAAWERPITHIRRFRAPEWVIRDHLNEIEEKQRIAARIEECINFKKGAR